LEKPNWQSLAEYLFDDENAWPVSTWANTKNAIA
jgi:hypothetical protein